MSFHKTLISKIKSNKKSEVYLLLDQLLNNHLNLSLETSFILNEIKKQHLDLLLSFISTDDNPLAIANYFNMILELYQKRNWSLDASSYSLIIRILCLLSRFDEAFKYLEDIENTDGIVKNRMIAPFFEKLDSNYVDVLIILFKKYHSIMLEQEYYYLLSKYYYSDLTIINQILNVWSNNDFIVTKKELLDLIINIINKVNTNRNTINLSTIIENNICNLCNNALTKHTLTEEERNQLKTELIISHPESEKNLIKFEIWLTKTILEYESNIIYILDGGNIGHSNNGVFSFEPIIKMVEKISIFKPVIILLILHQRHTKKYKTEINNLVSGNIFGSKVIVYSTPYQENDDLYWMLSSFILTNSFVVSNDLLRDHHVNKLNEVLFKRWKDNILINYDYTELYNPSKYTTGCQSYNNGWHIPFMNDNNQIEWICYDNT
jgi:hypothetical protein